MHLALLSGSDAPWSSGSAARSIVYLVDELVRQGHEATLMSTPEGAHDCDVVHFHCDDLRVPLPEPADVPAMATLHAPCAIVQSPDTDMPLIPTSCLQPRPDGLLNWRMPVAQGLPHDLHSLGTASGSHLVFSGPIAPNIGIESAVIAAARSGLTLKVVSDVPPRDRSYFMERFMPLLRCNTRARWVSEVDDHGRDALLGHAVALIAPYDVHGGSELYVAEALACGTPVIAWANTAAAHIVRDGVTGYVVQSIEEAANAIVRTRELDRRACRKAFEECFDIRQIARQYLGIYRRMLHVYDAAAVTVGSCIGNRSGEILTPRSPRGS